MSTLDIDLQRAPADSLYAWALCMSDPLMDPYVHHRALHRLSKHHAAHPAESATMLAVMLRGLGIASRVGLEGDVSIRLNAHRFGDPPMDGPTMGAWIDGVQLGLDGRSEWGCPDLPGVDASTALGSSALPPYVSATAGALIATATELDIYAAFYACRYARFSDIATAVRVLCWMARRWERLHEPTLVMLAAVAIDAGPIDGVEAKLRQAVERARALAEDSIEELEAALKKD